MSVDHLWMGISVQEASPGRTTVGHGGSTGFMRRAYLKVRGRPEEDAREILSGEGAARQSAMVQASLAIGAATTGTIAFLLPHPTYFNVGGLILVEAMAFGYAIGLLLFRDRVSLRLQRAGNFLAAVMTTAAVYYSGNDAGGYAVFYLWIGFYVFYYPVSRVQAIFNIAWAILNYMVAIAITPTPPGNVPHADVAFFVVVVGTLITAGVLMSYLRQRVDRLATRLVNASRTDPLTGLPNRVALHGMLERELERSRPQQRELALIVLDLDHFRQINELRGVSFGDRLLQRVSADLTDATRLIDTLARSGGEEFAVVMPETDQHQAFLKAEELLSRIRKNYAEKGVELTASAGVAAFPAHGDDAESLIASADRALNAAKALGRDRAVLYSPEVTSTLGVITGRRSIETQSQLATVLSLAEALDQRDSSTARHSQTVGRLCEIMARELGLDNARVARVRLAGILHDIGKIGVPDSILRKPGPLTDEERAQMNRHPELGARILSSGELDDVRGWILSHHERPDGLGYPKGLTADQIPLEASILAVADAYEAMTSDRAYRLAIGGDAAREELLEHAGTQFDRRVVEALLGAVDRDPAAIEA